MSSERDMSLPRQEPTPPEAALDGSPAPAATPAAAAPADAGEPSQTMLMAPETVPSNALRLADCAEAVREEVRALLGDPSWHADTSARPGEEVELLNQGRISEDDLMRVYVRVARLPGVEEDDLEGIEVYSEASYDYLTSWPAIPVSWDAQRLVMAVSAPHGVGQLAFQWQAMFGQRVEFVLARRSVIERLLGSLYDVNMQQEEEFGFSLDADASEQTLRDLAREAPIVRLVNDTIHHAVEMEASDIHVEPTETQVAIRYRVDGILQTVQSTPINLYAAIASRLKLLAGVNIAERRLPQDGRINWRSAQAELDIRVSTVPTMHGESIVLRLLKKDLSEFSLDTLGLPGDTRKRFEQIASMPHGMVLVVGPTGSGKTTTLYSVMRMLNSETRKIITIEDPVEYQLQGLSQIQVRSQIGLTFASGLRSIVRQDPDVILVGEIRDRETAEIAIHAALTGHLVLSTLHTNDAAGAISRLLEMGVESFLISSSLLGILSQRLVRRICPKCDGTGIAVTTGESQAEQRKRCRNCAGTGFRGRVGIFELLAVDEPVRRAVNERRDSNEIAALARRRGMRTLRDDGGLKVEAGVTTAAEIARVCQLDTVAE